MGVWRDVVMEVKPWRLKVMGRVGIQLGDGCQWCFVGMVWYLPLLSNARFLAFERSGECGDGVESGGGEGGIGEEGTVGCHVVFAPLEAASWFFGEKEVLGYRFTETSLQQRDTS